MDNKGYYKTPGVAENEMKKYPYDYDGEHYTIKPYNHD